MPKTPKLPATEQRNPRSRGLDLKSTEQILRVMNREDATVPAAVGREIRQIAKAVEAIVRALRRGGRVIYFGAGTSGRLAVLDASEIPPTFGVDPMLLRGVMAGGREALTDSVEGAEDDIEQGARDVRGMGISRRDVAVGLTASGSSPYVLGALAEARRHRAATVAITCNRDTKIARIARITIAPKTGPEVVTGSTRLKAGTAQKLVLNMLSTTAMVRLGLVYDNWMINVAQKNQKLRARAARILQEAVGVRASTAAHALRAAGHDLRVALVMLKLDVEAATARRKLDLVGGDLRRALGERRGNRR